LTPGECQRTGIAYAMEDVEKYIVSLAPGFEFR
jgi:hypothetical protein